MIHSERVRFLVAKYLEDVSPRAKDGIMEAYSTYLDSLCVMLSETFEEEERIVEYLDYVVEDMASFKKKLKAEQSSLVPYSKVLIFASKKDRLDSFLFTREMEKRIEEKRNDSVGMAGRKSMIEDSGASEISVLYGGIDHDLLEAKDGLMFFFSLKHGVVVQLLSGKIIAYRKYKENCLEKGIKYVSRLEIYRDIKKAKKKTEATALFNIIMRQRISRARKKRFKRKEEVDND